MRLPQLKNDQDVHTGDLTSSCMRRTALRWQQKFVPSCPTAMLRGSIFGKATELVLMDGVALDECVGEALTEVRLTLANEGRQLTEGAEKALPEMLEHVSQAMARWDEVMRHLGDGEKPIVIGCELPIRGEVECDGIAQPVASHIDILLRQRKTGRFVVVDTKWRDDAPTQAYLARNMQFGLYWLLAKSGRILFPGGKWYSLSADAALAWVHGPYLRPAGRATTFTDTETGEVIPLAKGDCRPIAKAVRWVPYRREHAESVREELRLRIRMMRAGMFPTNPDPVGCHTCESEQFCDRWDTAALSASQS